MKKVILFVQESMSQGIIDYIKKIGLEYGVEFEVLNTIEQVNKSEIKYIVTRGISKEDLYSMNNKIWYNDIELVKLVENKEKTKEYLINKGLGNYVIKAYTKEELKVEDFPVMLKDKKGKAGSNIYLCNTIEEIINIENENKDVEFFIEQYIGKNEGIATDYRVYLINFEPKLFIKRTNQGITSNVSKGGKIEIVAPLFEKELVEINKAIPLNVTAIDFTIDKDGGLKIFEMNSSPGVKALYENNIDAYRSFMKWYTGYIA